MIGERSLLRGYWDGGLEDGDAGNTFITSACAMTTSGDRWSASWYFLWKAPFPPDLSSRCASRKKLSASTSAVVRLEGLVDPRDHRGQRTQPGKLLMIDDQPKQLGGRRRPVRLVVGTALAAKQSAVKRHQSSAEITQVFASFVH